MHTRSSLKSTDAIPMGSSANHPADQTAPRTASQDIESQKLRAGFARECINPVPGVGVKMMGFGHRDINEPSEGIHDDIRAHALYLGQSAEQVLVIGLDLCLVGRDQCDRFKAAIGRETDVLPRQILINTSHSHMSPYAGTWWSGFYEVPDRDYLDLLEDAIVSAACKAKDSAREVSSVEAGQSHTALPMCRRKPKDDGAVSWEPYPEGRTYDRVPMLFLRDTGGKPICLMFSASTHPSFQGGRSISAEWPGAAVRYLDNHLGAEVSLFLQGVAGDSKAFVDGSWRGGWDVIDKCGRLIADDVVKGLSQGLHTVQPDLASSLHVSYWPLQEFNRADLEKVVRETQDSKDRDRVNAWPRYCWAQRQLKLLDSGRSARHASILVQGMRLADNVRIVALEGEPVAQWGNLIDEFYHSGKEAGLTFPLGYSNGQGAYLPISQQVPEGGYEVDSFWEYGLAAPLSQGMEDVVLNALATIRNNGIT